MENQQILDYVKSQCRSKRNFSGEEEFRVLKKGCDIDIFMTEVIATYRDQGKGAFSQKVGRATNKDYIQFRCERSAKPTGKKKGPTATRANSCGAYVSFKFFEGASWKACQIRLIAEHNGHSFAPEEGKVNNIDSELVSYIEYLSLQGQTVSDIIVKVGEWSKGRGHNDMRDRRFFPTPEDIAYHRRRTLAKTRLDANDASSVQKMCQGTIKDDILFFQNLSEAHQQPLIIVIQTNFMKDQLEKFAQNSTIFVDASYRGITSYGYAFYAVIARNDHGHGVPVAYVLTSKEDVQTLTLAFNKIKDASRANHQFIPRYVFFHDHE